MKRCRRCGQEKPLSEFYRRAGGTKLLAKCKPCVNEMNAEWRARNQARYRDTQRKHQRRHPRPQAPGATTRWRRRNPEKAAAQRAVARAVRDGRLSAPPGCEACGAEGLLHGHHDDYARQLDVRWLCPSCHKAVHATVAS